MRSEWALWRSALYREVGLLRQAGRMATASGACFITAESGACFITAEPMVAHLCKLQVIFNLPAVLNAGRGRRRAIPWPPDQAPHARGSGRHGRSRPSGAGYRIARPIRAGRENRVGT